MSIFNFFKKKTVTPPVFVGKFQYPNDADGDALRRIADDGVDMANPIEFEFSILVKGDENAKVIAEKLKAVNLADTLNIKHNGGYKEGEVISVENKDFWNSWTVTISHTMIPTYEAVIEFQQTLVELCGDIGKPDGWVVGV